MMITLCQAGVIRDLTLDLTIEPWPTELDGLQERIRSLLLLQESAVDLVSKQLASWFASGFCHAGQASEYRAVLPYMRQATSVVGIFMADEKDEDAILLSSEAPDLFKTQEHRITRSIIHTRAH